jgi:hypothetical protein
MYRFLIMLMCLCVCCVVWGQDTWAPATGGEQTAAAAADVATATVPAEVSAEAASADRLTLKQRRQLGLTIPAITKAYKSVKQAGIDPAASKSEIAAAVMEKLATDNPKAYASDTLDWEAILAFIERILDLILRLFPAT